LDDYEGSVNVAAGGVAGAVPGAGVGVGVASGAQEATTISNRTTTKVTTHIDRFFICVPPNYCPFNFPREHYLLLL
jgi:hypothetical protein